MCKRSGSVRIAFRLDADNKIGMGHAVRCSALAEALAGFGCECVYFCQSNREIHEFTISHGFGLEEVPKTILHDELNWMKNKLVKYDAVIIDSYRVSDEYISELERPGFTTICCDDNALYRYSCDVVVNGNLHAKELSFRTGRKTPEFLLGGQYTLLRREFRRACPIEIKKDAYNIFVCFGGSDLNNFTPMAIKVLQEIDGAKITAVIGPAAGCVSESYAVAKGNTRIFQNPPSIMKIMTECDIAITACGSMVYELAALGIPSIVTIQADNQELIAKYLEGNSLMKNLGIINAADAETLRWETENLLRNFKRRKDESKRLVKTVSLCGAENTALELLKIMGVEI